MDRSQTAAPVGASVSVLGGSPTGIVCSSFTVMSPLGVPLLSDRLALRRAAGLVSFSPDTATSYAPIGPFQTLIAGTPR